MMDRRDREHKWDCTLTLSLIPVAHSTKLLNGRGHTSKWVVSSSESRPELCVHVESGVRSSLWVVEWAGRSLTPGT